MSRLAKLFAVLLICSTGQAAAQLSATEKEMEKQGMVDIHKQDKTIPVSLMYARADNFVGRVLYTGMTRAYLHPKAAKALARAQQYLKKERPDLSLIVFDACRPMHIQKEMWDVVKGTSKEIYVSNPAHGGGLHNYGMAVDISLCNSKGDTIAMGTKVDHMGYLSNINKEALLLKRKKLSRQAYRNRLLLRRVMCKAGFKTLNSEWWHFNFVSRATAKKYYKYIK